jgi:D-alanine-D-alanine ligase
VRVLHVVGSPTDEASAELSRLYAGDCLLNTASPEYVFSIAHVEPGGTWRFPVALSPAALADAEPLALPAAVEQIAALDPEVVVPQLFCVPGMTAYRALFDVLGVPYVGNPAAVMALGADKALARAVVAAAGVAVPAGEVVRPGAVPARTPPVVVKPVDADNSLGVTLVRDPAGYPAALDAAFAHSGAALVEDYVELGREVRCGVLERDGELVVLPLEEYAVDGVRTPGDKLGRDGAGELRLMAKDAARAWIVDAADPVTAAVGAAARACHVALGCRDYSLFDFRVDPAGRPWFLEAGLYCSFARQSVVSEMAAAAGIALPDLFAGALAAALARG